MDHVCAEVLAAVILDLQKRGRSMEPPPSARFSVSFLLNDWRHAAELDIIPRDAPATTPFPISPRLNPAVREVLTITICPICPTADVSRNTPEVDLISAPE